MGKYSLVLVNMNDKVEHIIPVYDADKKEMNYKVHVKDIDAYTSKYIDLDQLTHELNKAGIINFTEAICYVVSKYKDETLHYKTIFGSKLIEETSKSVKAGYINPSLVESYGETVRNFMAKLRDKNYIDAIKDSIYFTNSNKSMLFKYSEILNQLDHCDNDGDLLLEEQRMRVNILEEIKRYKTFRGLFLFEKEMQKFARKTNRYSNNQKNNFMKLSEPQFIDSPIGYRDVDLYNKEYDEFLSPEEYENAYGSEEDEVIYKKGARHD